MGPVPLRTNSNECLSLYLKRTQKIWLLASLVVVLYSYQRWCVEDWISLCSLRFETLQLLYCVEDGWAREDEMRWDELWMGRRIRSSVITTLVSACSSYIYSYILTIYSKYVATTTTCSQTYLWYIRGVKTIKVATTTKGNTCNTCYEK